MQHVCLMCVQPVNEPCMRATEQASCVLGVLEQGLHGPLCTTLLCTGCATLLIWGATQCCSGSSFCCFVAVAKKTVPWHTPVLSTLWVWDEGNHIGWVW